MENRQELEKISMNMLTYLTTTRVTKWKMTAPQIKVKSRKMQLFLLPSRVISMPELALPRSCPHPVTMMSYYTLRPNYLDY